MKKTLLILGAILVIALGIFFVYRDKELKTPPTIGTGEVNTYRASLQGEYVCAPHVEGGATNTDECRAGLKTSDGKYYALDFNLASETPPQLVLGDRFEANGLVTPIEMLSSDMWKQYSIVGIFSVTDSAKKLNNEPIAYACNADAKICPDGSAVGRSGSDCQFTACPAADATSAVVRTSLGQEVTGLNVSLTPKTIVSDSRCPEDVTCIWAGTVEVKVVMSTKVGHGEQTFKLGETKVFGDYEITFTEVTPTANSKNKIADSTYRFTFEIKKK